MKKLFVLRGEGIECEKESFRFFSQPDFKLKVTYLSVSELLSSPDSTLSELRAGDWMLFPGGFSFADHLGSGRLLSFKLQEKNIYQCLLDLGVHMLGICNGFQILCAAQLFGANVQLKSNLPHGFRNQWVLLKAWDGEKYFFTCRHGEGRLSIEGSLGSGVRILMNYADENFDNGSDQKIAGLVARIGKSYVLGLMPHPEISLRVMDQSDFVAAEHPGEFSSRAELQAGEGMKFVSRVMDAVEEGKL